MKQEFKRMDDGKIKWTYEHEEKDSEDKDYGVVGKTSSGGYILFDSKEKALEILNRDIEESFKLAETHREAMVKNEYDEEKFALIKPLIDSIGKLHNDFNEVKAMPEKVNGANERKYHQLVRDFNKAKDFIVNEISELNKEYGKFLNYVPSKKAYDFSMEQYEKIVKQRDLLLALE